MEFFWLLGRRFVDKLRSPAQETDDSIEGEGQAAALAGFRRLDTNDDGELTPLDALVVINRRNARNESTRAADMDVAEDEDDIDLIEMIFSELS